MFPFLQYTDFIASICTIISFLFTCLSFILGVQSRRSSSSSPNIDAKGELSIFFPTGVSALCFAAMQICTLLNRDNGISLTIGFWVLCVICLCAFGVSGIFCLYVTGYPLFTNKGTTLWHYLFLVLWGIIILTFVIMFFGIFDGYTRTHVLPTLFPVTILGGYTLQIVTAVHLRNVSNLDLVVGEFLEDNLDF